MMGDGGCAIAVILAKNGLHAFKLAMMFLSLEGADHLLDEVIDVKELYIDGGIVDGDGEVVLAMLLQKVATAEL